MEGSYKMETVRTEEDLAAADKEYVEAVIAFNALDLGDESLDDATIGPVIKRYKDAMSKYIETHKSVHPEMYEGENAGKTYLPEAPLTKEAEEMNDVGGLAD